MPWIGVDHYKLTSFVKHNGKIIFLANFVDGVRTVSEIRDAVSAEFEPLQLQAVAEYLDLLARAGAVSFKR